MSELKVMQPMRGCQVVTWNGKAILFGQPPEVLKALLKTQPGVLDAVVLPDVRERSGVLLNNLEFLLYYFLFFENGLENGRRLKLVGEPEQIAQMLELLRLTTLGPTRGELQGWRTDPAQLQEWYASSLFFALKDEANAVRPVPSFFDLLPFDASGAASVGECEVRRLAKDRFEVVAGNGRVEVDLNEDQRIEPPYRVTTDYVPAGLAKFAVEVLGGASGFSPEAPSTGLALCFNGKYILIDAIPYLDEHLRARGISKNQISALFLTHLHDDHCNMFPLMQMPHKVDVITTREIYAMAMRKLAVGLGWTEKAIAEHFNFVELELGQTLSYYGLEIDPHHTVHSIPTVGAVFRASLRGRAYEICLVGDIQTFSEIADMRARGLVREETEATLHELYARRFDLLIADGGMGPIHGDPADALGSKAERVVFVHVEELPEEFNATFSLANAGKRYTIVEGDSDIYTTRTIECLMANFRTGIASPWLSTLFADKEIKRYNTDDVIIKQNSETWGDVFLILTGYCEVIYHDGQTFKRMATREAGDLMGEMAVITGKDLRNASVVARTPVTVCEFSEDTFNAFIEEAGLKAQLLERWSRRPLVGGLPQFRNLSTTVLDALCAASTEVTVAPGEALAGAGTSCWDIVCAGTAIDSGSGAELGVGAEISEFRPYACAEAVSCTTKDGCSVLRIDAEVAKGLIASMPQLNYALRKYRASDPHALIDWRLGKLSPKAHHEYDAGDLPG